MESESQEQIDILRSNAEGYASMGFAGSSSMCEMAARHIENMDLQIRHLRRLLRETSDLFYGNSPWRCHDDACCYNRQRMAQSCGCFQERLMKHRKDVQLAVADSCD